MGGTRNGAGTNREMVVRRRLHALLRALSWYNHGSALCLAGSFGSRFQHSALHIVAGLGLQLAQLPFVAPHRSQMSDIHTQLRTSNRWSRWLIALGRSALWCCACLWTASRAQAQSAEPQLAEAVEPATKHAPSKEGQAASRDRWTDPFFGVRYLVRQMKGPSRVVHAVVANLEAPGVRLRATPYENRWQTVSEYAEESGAAVAINGGFWGFGQRAKGIAAGGGVRWPDGEDDDEAGFFAIGRGGQAWISPPERVVNRIPSSRLSDAVSGLPMLVRNGNVDQAALAAFPGSRLRHPRTAVGVGKSGAQAIFVVVDGRQGHSRGLTLYELAEFFVELGAESALNLDGGGSSAMYVEGRIVNSPSGGRFSGKLGLLPKGARVQETRITDAGVQETIVRGVEREVMNHLGIFASKTAPAVVDAGLPPAPPTVRAKPPKPPLLRIGRLREWLCPVAGLLVGLFGVTVWFLIRRRRARKRRTPAP